MTVSSSSLLFPILVLFLSHLPPATSSERSVLLTACSGSNYTSSSSYAASLNRLLANISTSVSQHPSLFATTVSDDTTSPIFALAQCRPDSTPQQCNICIQDSINTSANSSSHGCPLRRSAAIRYDYCLIRYSDRAFLGSAVDDERMSTLLNTETASYPAEFEKRATALISDVAAKATVATTRFATNESSSGEPEEFIYGMAWCALNLPSEDCSMCFQQAIEALQFEQIGEQVNGIDCVLRFENMRFYDLMTPRPPASQLPGLTGPTTPNSGPASHLHRNGKDAFWRRTVLLTIAAFAVALALC